MILVTFASQIGEWMNGREPEVQLDVPHVFPEHTNAKWRILTTPVRIQPSVYSDQFKQK